MLRQSDAANVKNQTDIVNNKASEQEVETSQFAALAHKLKTQEEAKSESSPSIFAKLKSKFSKKKTPAAVRTIEEKPDDAPPPYESMDDIRALNIHPFLRNILQQIHLAALISQLTYLTVVLAYFHRTNQVTNLFVQTALGHF